MAKVGIIGGGVSGLFSAYYLTQDGHEVTVLDDGRIKYGSSFGNAGMIVPSHMVPLASPGVVSKGIAWLFNSESPFYIRPTLDLKVIKWLWQFHRHSNQENVDRNISALAEIGKLSRSLYLELESKGVLDIAIQKQGILMLYQSAETGKEEAELARKASEYGIPANILSIEDLNQLDPNVRYSASGAVHFTEDATIQPAIVMENLFEKLKEFGIEFVLRTNVTGISEEENKIKVTSDEDSFEFEKLVIASGNGAPNLTRQLGFELPILSGKGYSFDVRNTIGLKYPALLLDHKVSVTPMGNKIRFGGTMELGQPDDKVNLKRVKGIVSAISKYYPDLEIEMPGVEEIWMGYRPCTPDGLPYIGQLPGHENVFIAAGHGMVGMSLGPATGHAVSKMLGGDLNLSYMENFNPGRHFRRKS